MAYNLFSIMNNIHNFVNRQLCEYQSIFPTVASLLEHLLFVIGNGYDFIDGMIVCDHRDGSNQDVRIDEFPEMTSEAWDQLIKKCHEKEAKFATQFAIEYGSRFADIFPARDHAADLAEKCAKYKSVAVNDSQFTEESLYADLRNTAGERKQDEDYWGDEVLFRPYPLSTNYSDIFHLDEKTPAWFLQIALNLCNAWVRFLTEELEAGNVYKEPPTPLEGEQFIGSGNDYANAEWTTKHRDMLVEQIQRLEELLKHA